MQTEKISEAAANEYFEFAKDTPLVVDCRQHLCLSVTEWTAAFHDVPVSRIASWRRNGWPSICPVCSERLDPKQGFWIDELNKLEITLIHTTCIQRNRSELQAVFAAAVERLNHPLGFDDMADLDAVDRFYGSEKLITYARVQFSILNERLRANNTIDALFSSELGSELTEKALNDLGKVFKERYDCSSYFEGTIYFQFWQKGVSYECDNLIRTVRAIHLHGELEHFECYRGRIFREVTFNDSQESVELKLGSPCERNILYKRIEPKQFFSILKQSEDDEQKFREFLPMKERLFYHSKNQSLSFDFDVQAKTMLHATIYDRKRFASKNLEH